MLKLRLGLYVLLFLGLSAGCGSKNPNAPGKVSGRVVYNGTAVPGGNISFHTKGQGVYNSSIGTDGTYEIYDIPIGEAVVTVETETANASNKEQAYGGGKMAKMSAERRAAEQKMGRPVATAPAGQYRKIPTKYNNPKTSPVSITIEAGRQVHEIPLKD